MQTTSTYHSKTQVMSTYLISTSSIASSYAVKLATSMTVDKASKRYKLITREKEQQPNTTQL